jgi:primosomal protein N' (replication factor Y)
MRCHYCNVSAPLPDKCPHCQSLNFKSFGIGTQQVEEEFKKLFPNTAVMRMDSDTVTEKGAYERILSDFGSGKTQVLIGTQMIAKGHDFPNVTLVGVVAADTTLNLPNYLSRERTFQLLTQVAGRSGRKDLPGKVFVQTYMPDHPVIKFAQAQDFQGFFHYELVERKKCCLPPFSVFVRLLFTGEDEEKLADISTAFAVKLENALLSCLGEAGSPALLQLYAAPAPVARIQGKYRWQVLCRLLRSRQLKDALGCIYKACDAVELNTRPLLEINPTEMY